MDSLVVTPISQASCKQRAGRAGRTGPSLPSPTRTRTRTLLSRPQRLFGPQPPCTGSERFELLRVVLFLSLGICLCE